jgi:phosphatidate phosphatase APP1
MPFARIIVAVCMLITSWISHLFGQPLSGDEAVMFFATTARRVSDVTIEISVEAWVYETERRPGVTTAFRHYLKLDPDTLGEAEYAEFRRRVRLFLTDSEGGKRVPITITTPLVDEPMSLGLPTTPANGYTASCLLVPAPREPDTRWIEFETRGPEKTFRGRALLVPDEGLSVISDIDDTIKHTHVLDRREMLLNTFARPLQSVPGMAELYARAEAAAGGSTRFHYVSGGPHQLWPMLDTFLSEHGFPEGSVHLRMIDWRKEVFGEGSSTFEHKLATIAGLMRDFPRRRYVLVGDSGEKDPEVYGEIARQFPTQVTAIHIRDVTGEPREASRYAEAFRDVPAERWSLFTDPAAVVLVTPPPEPTKPPPGG